MSKTHAFVSTTTRGRVRAGAWIALVAIVAFSAGCAHQKPVLYSANNQNAAGDQAIDACTSRAESAGLSYKRGSNVGRNAVENGAVGGAGGAVAGAIFGNAARGAAAGAAGGVASGLVRGIFHHDGSPSPAYQAYINRCLRDQGYDPIGWN